MQLHICNQVAELNDEIADVFIGVIDIGELIVSDLNVFYYLKQDVFKLRTFYGLCFLVQLILTP